MTYVLSFLNSVFVLFLEMAPYLVLGLSVAGVFSVIVRRDFVSRHVGKPGMGSVFKAAILGVPLPLCSCGVVPTASYFKHNGASKPALVSFLISTPQTGVDSIVATYGMLGPLFAILRPVIALVTGIAGGATSILLGRDPKTGKQTGEGRVAPEMREMQSGQTFMAKIRKMVNYAYVESIDDIAFQFVIGLGIAGLISLLIPNDFFKGMAIAEGFTGMLMMIIIGIPMYICSTSSIPVAVALIAKGISPGAAYVFLVAGPATNAATLLILNRILGLKHTVLYLVTIIAGSMAFGPLVNLLVGITGWNAPIMGAGNALTGAFTGLEYISAAFLAVLLLGTLYRKIRYGVHGHDHSEEGVGRDVNSDASLEISGMTCAHCAANVETVLRSVEGVDTVQVNFQTGRAIISGVAHSEDLIKAVQQAGYSAKI